MPGEPGAAPPPADRFVAGLFRVWSAFYDQPLVQRAFYRRVHAVLHELLPAPPPRAVLDLGCGTALLTADLAARLPDALVLGVDLSHDMLVVARRRLGAAAMPLLQATSYALPIADGAVDLVTSTISYHFYLEPARALAEVRRVLAPGGHLLLATLSSELLRVRPLRRGLELGMAGRTRLAPPEELRDELGAAGFDVVRVEPVWPAVRILVGRRT